MTAINTNDFDHGPAGADAKAQEAELVTYGVLAEYDTVDSVVEATKACRDAGYKKIDVYAPFPIHGIEAAMGMKMTILPWIVLCCGLTGMTIGTILTTYTMGGWAAWFPSLFGASGLFSPMIESLQGYSFMIAGKPYGEIPQFFPPMYELTILLSAFGSVFGMFLLNKLPMLYHPLYRVDRFKRATDDRFFLVVEAGDQKFDEEKTAAFLQKLEPISVEVVQDEDK